MGGGASKGGPDVLENYTLELKNPAVVAAMEALGFNKRTTGLSFYRIFADMDTDGSKSIDLDEFHRYFGLPHTRFSDLVFSNLGKQAPARGVPFDDFMLNLWNFCTMSPRDLYSHVFQLYDDDGNGTLDVAECDSLFRLLYNTEILPDTVNQLLKDIDQDGDGEISLDEFLMLCMVKKNLFKPIFDLQARARSKSLGKRFWAKESKKRVKILGWKTDIFEAASERYRSQKQSSHSSFKYKLQADSTTGPQPAVFDDLKTASGVLESANAPEGFTEQEQAMDERSFEAWLRAEPQQQPEVRAYLTAHAQAYVVESLLKEASLQPTNSPEQVQQLLDLRRKLAVFSKKRDEAKAILEEAWCTEQNALLAVRRQTVTSMVEGISTKTLLKQTDKKSAKAAIKSYTQKKMDVAENEVRRRFNDRRESLEHAAEYVARRELNAARLASVSTMMRIPPMVSKRSSNAGEVSTSKVAPTMEDT